MNEILSAQQLRTRPTTTVLIVPDVEVDGHRLRVTNLDKVLYPDTGFTKGDVLRYYVDVAPALLPHLAGRPLTRVRFPDGVFADSFFEKQTPSHAPDWVTTVAVESGRAGTILYPVADSLATLVWLANLAALELHALLARAAHLDQPDFLVFDLDPTAPADLIDAVRVALQVRDLLDDLELASFPKVSGSKGLHLYVPLNSPTNYEATRGFAHALAQTLEKDDRTVTSTMAKSGRRGKIFVDWGQNASFKTTVAPYSLRARPTPSVSAPVTWDELEAAEDPADLRFTPDNVVARLEAHGDVFAPVLELNQQLPGS